ncbi:hypothetical protein [Streptomyces sp. NPDC048611]|uniref:hypothetical protein n=1 Tax=Streptomyces sp. NPDC048611 TaxID=3155635 RepID=UPI003447D0B6
MPRFSNGSFVPILWDGLSKIVNGSAVAPAGCAGRLGGAVAVGGRRAADGGDAGQRTADGSTVKALAHDGARP